MYVGQKITQTQASKDTDLQKEVDEFNPVTPRKELPRGENVHFLNLSTSSTHDTEPLNDSDKSFQENISFENPFDISVLSNNSNKTLVDLGDSYSNNSLENLSKIKFKMSTSVKLGSGEQGTSGPQNQNLNPNQQPAAIQVVTSREALMVVPEFNGKNIPLGQFIEGCNEAKCMIKPESGINLVKLLRSKISGEARQAISGRTFLTIDKLKSFLKNIYSTARTILQLLGELGYEFQRENENVITFANRIRDIGTKILEVHNLDNGGKVDPNFRDNVENTMSDSFERGLKFELELRLGNEQIQDVNNLVQSAITIERKLEAQRNLRKTVNHKTENINERTRMFSCQICKRDGHETENFRSKLWCSNCKMNGHSIKKCFKNNRNRIPEQVICQLCNKQGHTATQCFGNQECQLCKKRGHTAKDCFLNKTAVRITCQLCSKQGHSADKCFSLNKPVRPVPTELNKVLICQICNRNGHEAAKYRVPEPTALKSNDTNGKAPKRIITIDIEEDSTKIPFISTQHPVMNDSIKLMLDTGSELNILKIKKISPLQTVNLEGTVFLKGIDSVVIPSIGTIKLTLMGHTVKFYIVPDAFFIPFDGILGSEYYINA